MNGSPVMGGADSLFTSIHRSLPLIKTERSIPKTDVDLRVELVDELLNNPDKYDIKLTRQSRKELKLMRREGQLPSLDVLLAASRLYKVRFCVYFWSEKPVVYQFRDYEAVIHIQCLGGIHFNPLIEVPNASNTSYAEPCSIHSVYFATTSVPHPREDSDCDYGEVDAELSDDSLAAIFGEEDYQLCAHSESGLPQIDVSFGDHKFCAILDTGAEISLVSESTIEALSGLVDQRPETERLCDIVGFSGEFTEINQTILLSLNIGQCGDDPNHKFAIVSDSIFPHCFLLGIDFLHRFRIDIDFNENVCSHSGTIIERIYPETLLSTFRSLAYHIHVEDVLAVDDDCSHKVRISEVGDQLRVDLEGNSETLTGLSLLIDDDVLRTIQSQCEKLERIKDIVTMSCSEPRWTEHIKPFKRHIDKLTVCNDILLYTSNSPNSSVPVIPFEILVNITLLLHNNLAHIGRDKLLDALFGLGWHPLKYMVANDVASTCHQCQLLKETPGLKSPPTIKIKSSYPYQLMAADLMTLPRTSSGFIGCLVVVDHYCKFLSCVPIRNKKSATIIHAFKTQIFPFLTKIPETLLTDNGPEFASQEFTDFLSECGVKHQFTTPYCPSSNGAVERTNRTVQGFLRSLSTNGEQWDVNLSKAVITYNNTLHSEIQMSPSDFLLTRSHVINNSHSSAIKDLTSNWKIGNPKFQPYKPDDLVLLKLQHKGFLNVNKLLPKFRGPFKIIKSNDNNVTYQILDDKSNVIKVHYSQLKPYKIQPDYLAQNNELMTFDGDADGDGDDAFVIFNDSTETSTNSLSSKSSSSITCESSGESTDVCDDVSVSSTERLPSESERHDELVSDDDGKPVVFNFCRGCLFEAENNPVSMVEKMMNLSITSILNDETEENASGPPAVLDWRLDDWQNWQMSSIDTDQICNETLETDRDLERHSGETGLAASENQAAGLTSSGTHSSDKSLSRLEHFIGNAFTSTKEIVMERRHTRSMGPVADLPNVQTKILERKN